MFRGLLTYIIFLLSFSSGLRAQYIYEVMDYKPAPGQFINSLPWGTPGSASSLVGGVNGHLSLGAFGGSVIFRFEHPVENHPDNPYGIDFTIFGNATADWSEPGVVWVMKDENENGLADDTWYELAGSDYYFSTTRREYEVRYTNPGTMVASDVPWSDSFENSGAIRANSLHPQTYYPLSDSFPDIPDENYVLTGTMIQGTVDVDHPPLIKSLRRSFGYADNQVRGPGPDTIPDNPYTLQAEHSGGDAFDISWAVNREGSYVELDRIHFVKVQTGILHEGGWLGELSTEITGAVDVAPDGSLSGVVDVLAIKDLPVEVNEDTIRLEIYMFHMGRPVSVPGIIWSSSQEWAVVDEQNILILSGNGPLTLTATTAGGASPFTASVSTMVNREVQVSLEDRVSSPGVYIYPNPASEWIRIEGVGPVKFSLFDLSGKRLMQKENYTGGDPIDISALPRGMYLIKPGEGKDASFLKLLKQ